jgi:transposase-like protein
MSQLTNGKIKEAMTETEVVEKAKRRQYSAEYKQRILREAETSRATGEIGALLRREGLYSSHLTTWRRQCERGELEGLSPQKRGPKADAQAVELGKLKRENERLRERLRKAELIIEVQKKVSQILGVALPESDQDEAR